MRTNSGEQRTPDTVSEATCPSQSCFTAAVKCFSLLVVLPTQTTVPLLKRTLLFRAMCECPQVKGWVPAWLHVELAAPPARRRPIKCGVMSGLSSTRGDPGLNMWGPGLNTWGILQARATTSSPGSARAASSNAPTRTTAARAGPCDPGPPMARTPRSCPRLATALVLPLPSPCFANAEKQLLEVV